MQKLINRKPSLPSRVILGVLPFIFLLFIYGAASNKRLTENPSDKLLPSFASFGEAINRYGFTEDRRTGEYLLWVDTKSSLRRLLIGVSISAALALILGLATGAVPYLGANFSPIITAISLVPPMAILPILFIVFGLGELAKVMLIIIGIAPFLVRDTQQRVMDLPKEQIIKAQTLGANTWQIIVRIMMPQVMPHLMASIRLSLGSAWLFLIAAEAIASTDGLGYRIFLVRRYLAMDVILPYVVWITLLAFGLDYVLRKISQWWFPWHHTSKN